RAGRESLVALPESIPVSIGYFTVWVDGDGTVRFLPDVYRHDAGQAPLLDDAAAPVPAPARTVATLEAAGQARSHHPSLGPRAAGTGRYNPLQPEERTCKLPVPAAPTSSRCRPIGRRPLGSR